MRPRLLRDAEQELRKAIRHYQRSRPGLGAEFYRCVADTMTAVGDHPQRFPAYEGGGARRVFRRARVKRFPYVVVFEIRADEVLVVAIAHASRKPGYWQRRK
jgi:plasmid stabilization system protein ParE